MEKFLSRLLDWLERVLPTALATFTAGFRAGKNSQAKIEADLQRAMYEIEKLKNLEIVREKYEGKSNKQVLDSFLSSVNDSGKGKQN